MSLRPLHAFLIEQGGKPWQVTWAELAVQFGYKKGKSASTSWSNFKVSSKGRRLIDEARQKMVVVQEKRDGDGNLVSQTSKLKEDPVKKYEFSDDKVIGGTTNPYGSDWIRFSNKDHFGISEYQIDQLREELSGKIKVRVRKRASRIGVVDVSDLHAGSVLKYMEETIKTKEFNTGILMNYLSQTASIINSYKFSEVHLMIPGDIVETFTAFNHKDTWKHVSAHGGSIIKIIYAVLKRFVASIDNVSVVYMVEGNHDRMTSGKDGNSRKGVVDVVNFFLQENCSGIEFRYHPWMVSNEIDGINHMMSHGDFKAYKKHDFWFRYGKQGMYNVYRTGHFHGFNVLRHTHENLHYQCPSLFTGNFFSESIGYDAVPAIIVLENHNGLPKLHYEPLDSEFMMVKRNL